MFGLTPKELRLLRSLNTPIKIQRFLDTLNYHENDTAWSPRKVLREGTAHCLEGSILAAAAFYVNGTTPLLVDHEAIRDTDHVLAVFQHRKHWGAVALSHYAGLRYREPVYRTLRELSMSYFDAYCNHSGDRTLRTYSRPLDIRRYDHLHWMTSEKNIWFIPEYFVHCHHTKLLKPWMEKLLVRVGNRNYAAQMVGTERFNKIKL